MPDGHPLLASLATIPACQRRVADADWFPPVDIVDDAEEYIFKIDLPDVRPENINVTVEQDGLIISGDRPDPYLEDKRCLRIERPHGYFVRRFALPEDASRTEVNSTFEDSVLELRVHKVRQDVARPPASAERPKLRLHREIEQTLAEGAALDLHPNEGAGLK